MSNYTSKQIKARQASRIIAVQCLYAATIYQDYSNIKTLVESVATNQSQDDFFVEQYNSYDKNYLLTLITGAIAELDALTEVINPFLAQDWSMQRLGQVVKCILWLGAWEILNADGLTPATLINEYINIAKIFNHEGESGFINNVLDQVARSIPQPDSEG